MSTSKVLRDLLVCELQKQNNYLRNERKFNKKYKVKVIEHVINPSGTIQEETIGIESCRAYVLIKKNNEIRMISCSLRYLVFLDEDLIKNQRFFKMINPKGYNRIIYLKIVH